MTGAFPRLRVFAVAWLPFWGRPLGPPPVHLLWTCLARPCVSCTSRIG